jgi:cytoskeletal protein RodZ
MFDKLAEELKETRIKNNLTLKQLSVRTRIDLKFLEAMEEGNFSFLPELYVKAFVKEYANAVGLNPEITLKKYEAAREGLTYEEPIQEQIVNEMENREEESKSDIIPPLKPEEKSDDKTGEHPVKFREVKHSAHQSNAVYSKPPALESTSAKRSESSLSNKNSLIIGAGIAGIIILTGLVYVLFFNKSSEIVVTEKPYDEVVTESRQRYEETPVNKTDSLQKSAVSNDSLNLLIQTTDTSWVKLILDNTKEEEFILFPNSQKSLKAASNFKITFGRSSAIKLQLNNKPLPFVPRSKAVSHIKIDSNGVEYLQNPPQAGQG